MSDLDTRLRESLEQHVSAVPTPPVDVQALLARGQRARLLRMAGAGALTTGVVAAAVSLALLLPRDGGSSLPPGDSGSGLPVATGGARGPDAVRGPTGLFVTRQQVFLGGSTYDVKLPWDTGAHISANGVAYPADRTGQPTLLGLDGSVTQLAQAPRAAGARFHAWIAADSGSGLVAWAEHGQTSADIVAFDTETMTEVGRTSLRCTTTKRWGTSCPVPYVVAGGEVFIMDGPATRIWDPADDSLGEAVPGPPSQAHNGVITGFEGETFPEDAYPGWEQANVPQDMEAILSYDGNWLLDNGGRPRVVNWRDPDQTIRYRPPGAVQAATFDTDGSVLVVTRDKDLYTGWDCPIDAECAQVVSPRRQEVRLVAWDL